MDYENDTSWVRGMLQPGENLLWTGKPERLRIFGKEDIFLIPFSLFWCGFLVFMITMVWKSDSPPMVRLFFLPFVLAGLWLLVGRFIPKLISAKNERYALTSQRIIIRKGKTTQNLELGNLPAMSVTRRNDGSGDIRFGDGAGYYRDFNAFGWNAGRSYQLTLPELRAIPDVDRVEYRIRQAAEQLREARNG